MNFLLSVLLFMSMAFAVKQDNTAINVRDRNNITAGTQALGSNKDVEITRQVRREILSVKGLSTYAKNIKIVTLGGRVYLRGPVRTESEKEVVAAHAGRIAGFDNVTDELEVVQK